MKEERKQEKKVQKKEKGARKTSVSCYVAVFSYFLSNRSGSTLAMVYTWCPTRENLYTKASSTDRQSMV